jgi:glycosyltransferase involved in cell wall biosynthesis
VCDNNLRILMLIDQFYPVMGGAEQQALRISLELIKLGHEVSVLTRRSRKKLAEEEIYRGIQIHRLPYGGVTGGSKLKSTLPAARWLIRHQDQYDIIHCHGNNPLEWAAMLAGQIIRKPYLIKLTNPNFYNYAGANRGFRMDSQNGNFITNRLIRPAMLPALRFVRRRMIRRADRVLAISPQIKASLNEQGYDNISGIPNGIDSEEFAPVAKDEKMRLREKLKLAEDSVVFIFAGRFAVEKNLMTLVRAWNDLIQTCDRKKYELLLLGDSNGQNYSSERELRRFAKEKNMLTLSFRGSVPNVKDYLHAADVFVLPSIWEGMSNALLEAMACGLPSVVSDIPANRNLVEDKSSGLLFPVKDSCELTKCMLYMIENENDRHKMGLKAREIIEERFSISAVVCRIMSEYKNVLNHTEKALS